MDNAELESFRREWREEVSRRSKPRSQPTPQSTQPTASAPPSAGPAPAPPRLPPYHEAAHRNDLEEEGEGEEEDGPSPAAFDPDGLAQQVGELSVSSKKKVEEDIFARGVEEEPNSALEHFERAVEKEAAGNLGDSLQHYRRAYRVSRT